MTRQWSKEAEKNDTKYEIRVPPGSDIVEALDIEDMAIEELQESLEQVKLIWQGKLPEQSYYFDFRITEGAWAIPMPPLVNIKPF